MSLWQRQKIQKVSRKISRIDFPERPEKKSQAFLFSSISIKMELTGIPTKIRWDEDYGRT